jgi:hypothetical protein
LSLIAEDVEPGNSPAIVHLITHGRGIGNIYGKLGVLPHRAVAPLWAFGMARSSTYLVFFPGYPTKAFDHTLSGVVIE